MDYELIILHTLVEIVMDEDASEHLKELRIAALNKVLRRLNAYHHLGFIRPLTTAIAEKKFAVLQSDHHCTNGMRCQQPYGLFPRQ